MRHFKRKLPAIAITQFLHVHDLLVNIELHLETPDSVTWLWTPNGQYSAMSAYEMQFEGSIRFPFRDTVWNSGTPLKCRVFCWMALRGKCNTADCLQKKVLDMYSFCILVHVCIVPLVHLYIYM